MGTEGFMAEQQGQFLKESLKYLKLDLEYIPIFKDMHAKLDHVK